MANSADSDYYHYHYYFNSIQFKVKGRMLSYKAGFTFTTILANSVDDKLMMFFLFFPENRIWYFMQIISMGDNLHEMSKTVF